MTTNWASATRDFQANLPGYEQRESQTLLAQAIEGALDAHEPILAQAPTGTGKSFVAIIMMLRQARELGLTCVAATATKALQDQYIDDCKFIKKHHFPEFRFMILKGRGNYLCQAKMAKADELLLALPKSLDEINKVANDDEVIGDVERLGFDLTPVQKRALTTTSDECPGKSNCKFGATCFAEKAKAKAESADLVVVNHALLAIDATLKAKNVALLPAYPAVIIDEAHEFRSYVEGALSAEITRRGLSQLFTEVGNFADDLSLVGTGRSVIDPLFGQFDRLLDPAGKPGASTQAPLTPALLAELAPYLTALYEAVEDLEAKVALVKVYSDDDINRKNRMKRRVESMKERITKVMVDEFAQTVRWVERDVNRDDPERTRGIMLCTAPLDVAPFLNEMVWQYTSPVLMSATLAVGDDFTYMARELGLDLGGPYRSFDCPTPFDFKTQARTYIPEDMPDLRTNPHGFRADFLFKCGELIKASDGRALLLFTSWTELNAAYQALAPKVEAMGHRALKQGDMPSRRLADTFAADEHSVLFATKTFFTGVNIQGDSLRLLIIQKCPFHYPDVLWKARCDAIDVLCDDRSKWTKGAFPTLQVPDMTMTLIQGFGRLIRTKNDRGMVAIFDNALSLRQGKRYGKTVRNSLPKAPVLTTLTEAVDYLGELDGE
jgi:ATP-dependent DNA helicase DinG